MEKILSFIKTNWLKITIFLLIFGSLIRLLHLTYIGYSEDTLVFFKGWANSIYNMGLLGFWNNYKEIFDYMPLMIIILYPIGLLNNLFSNTNVSFLIIWKMYIWIIEIGLLIIIARILINYLRLCKIKVILLTAFIYSFPPLFFISSIWGQIDTIVSILAVISILFLLSEHPHKNIFSAIFISISLLIKLQAIIILPIILLLVIFKNSKKDIEKFFLSGSITTAIIVLPFIISNFNKLIEIIKVPFTRDNWAWVSGYNIWAIFFERDFDSSKTLFSVLGISFSLNSIGLILMLILVALSSLFYIKILHSKKDLNIKLITILFGIFLNLVFFLFLTKIHSRYMHTALILGLIGLQFINIRKNIIYILSLLLISSLYFINNWSVLSRREIWENSITIWNQVYFKIFFFNTKTPVAIGYIISFIIVVILIWKLFRRNLS